MPIHRPKAAASKAIFTFLMATCLLFSVSSRAFAQNSGEMDQLVADSKNDLLVVVSGGLAGAILGLSTLSFVEEPKEHTKNILVGASLGIVAGVGYVAFSQANKSREMLYGANSLLKPSSEFGTSSRSAWHRESFEQRLNPISSPLSLGYVLNY